MTSRVALAVAVSLAFVGSAALAQAAKPAAKKPAAAEKPLPQADQAQLDAAERTHFGNYDCDQKQTIDVSMNPKNPGYVDVKFKKDTWTMKPSVSSTGALRLEDVKGRTLLLQIANKSMLMDTKAGRRLVDSCVHEKQRAAAEAAAK
ncbi:MAG: hypothetical protein KF892_07195 [Rhizobacter sp.]|nr:hypothetical protein [Rhizobacter sp.]